MPYIIDGHNLIPHLPGLDLSDLDDEQELIKILVDFCRDKQKDATVYFDQAASHGSPAKTYGRVTAKFVRSDRTADSAIAQHLKRIGSEARNWTVVSSDLEVQDAARRAGARVLSSPDFTIQLQNNNDGPDKTDHPSLSSQDVNEWLNLFGEDDA